MRNEISPPSHGFELTGEFGGVVFTATGKRRMVLRTATDGEQLLKVPKPMRRRVVGNFRLGQMVWVAGSVETDALTGQSRRVVSRMLPAEAVSASVTTTVLPQLPSVTTIRVCAKKNCWRNGGRELWRALEETVAARGLSDAVRLKAVGCMDRCQAAPNAECRGRAFQRCTPMEVETIIARADGAGRPRSD